MALFVNKDSIVRSIWGKGDTILFIFAGASAEFALNKAVDWLYFTGRLPADPIGRMFSTVNYARMIVFSDLQGAMHAIDKIAAIHQSVELGRNAQIPDWAYRDVLFMLIDYSIRAFETLERKMTAAEQAEVFAVFYQVGFRLGIKGLPLDFTEWQIMRSQHLIENLVKSDLTIDLYQQYRKHLGWIRYQLLKEVQVMVVPKRVKQLLGLGNIPLLLPVLQLYKLSRWLKLDGLIRNAILPQDYKSQVKDLDQVN